jgi:O-antigen ligase
VGFLLEFNSLVLNSHQFFFALVVCAFSFFLVMDLPELKEKASAKYAKFLMILLAVITCGVFIVLLDAWETDGLFLAFEFSLLVMFSLIHPKYAVSFLVYLLLSRPWESYDNQMMASMPRDIFYLAVISLVAHKFFRREFYFRFNFGTVLLLAFAVWVFLSGFFSQHTNEAMYMYTEIFMKGVILFILIQNGIERTKDMLPVKAVFVLAILEKCFVSFYKSNLMDLGTIVEDANERLESVGILSNSNDIAAIFVLAIPFTVFFILKTRLRPFNWLVAIVASLAMVILVWQSQSRGALLGIFAIIGAYTLIKIKSKKLRILVIAIGLVGTLGAFKMMNRGEADIEGSTTNRILYWKAGLNMAVRNPVFGVGFWGFPRNLPAYAPEGNVGSEKEHMTAHSSWVLILAEGGFTALVLFIGLWAYATFAAWKIRFDQPEYLLAIAGYGMSITFLSHTYLLYPYILLALVITQYHIQNGLKQTRGFV